MTQVLCQLPKFNDPNLLIGFDTSDDAAVYRLDEKTALIQTVDLFPPIVDDPLDYGRIAASNALSDVYAMGGSPRIALNILCIPEDFPDETVKGILQGGYEKVLEAGAVIAGGHTIRDGEPKYGLSVTGIGHPKEIITNSGAKPGDILILTKALGTGILTTAKKAGILGDEEYKGMVLSMAELNKNAAEIMKKFKVNSCTDITGFGLFGHAYEMGIGSGCSIRIDAASLPILSGATEFARMGIIPAGLHTNRDFLREKMWIHPSIPLSEADLFFDPQTSGGLLIAVPKKEGKKLLAELQESIPLAMQIGEVVVKDQFCLYAE